MVKPNKEKQPQMVERQEYRKFEEKTSLFLCRLNVLKSRRAHDYETTTTMTRTNLHRKIRNSREIYSKLQETLSIRRISTEFIYPKLSLFPSLSTLLFRRSRFRCSFWQTVMVIALLELCASTKVISALQQQNNSNSILMKISEVDSTMTTTKMTTAAPSKVSKYSQPFKEDNNNGDSFRPIIPKDINTETISQNIFTKTGQYRVFGSVDSDLRQTVKRASDVEVAPLALLTPVLPGPPVGYLKSFHKQSEVLTLQSKRKAASEVNLDVKIQQKGSNKDQAAFNFDEKKATDTNRTTHDEFLIQTKLNQPPVKGKYVERTFMNRTNGNRRGEIGTSRKQLSPNIRNFSKENKTTHGSGAGGFDGSELGTEIKDLENLLANYVDDFFNKGQYQPKPELILALQQNFTKMRENYEKNIKKFIPDMDTESSRPVRQVLEKRADDEKNTIIPRALESGRLLFFAGLKKVMWPIYMGLQVLKSLMFALLLPTLIGSFGKLLGKGISSGSAPLFIRPMDEPQDLDFRDNNFNFDDDSTKFSSIDDVSVGGNVKDGGGSGSGYAYNQAEASQTHNHYAYNAAAINNQALSRYGMNERQQLMQDSYLSALQSLGAASFKNSNGFSGSSSGNGGGGGGGGLAGLVSPMRPKPASPANMNTFQQFQKVPASSLLLSNYDPFYSPLLSRLDSVFAQLKLNSEDETCREKVICLMYANPAKYAPYSNLVSAQLSRELNELRKPTSDNPDILRFFKYMRAAKDGQDGIDCEKSFEKCTEFKDFENPAMVSTYHDINKLVQARKFS